MRYGKFIKEGSTIAVTSPSFGCGGYPYIDKGRNAFERISSFGYKLIYTPNTFTFDINNIVNFPEYSEKAKELQSVLLKNDVDVVWSIAGGELMCKTIYHLDLKKLEKMEPKWYVGFSDNTWMTFLLPTMFDIASIYDYTFTYMGTNDYSKSHNYLLQFLTGNNKNFYSFDKCELDDLTKLPGNSLLGLNLTIPTYWKGLRGENDIEFSGRMIGGCLEILIDILGTNFDKVGEFNEKYKDDGFIWYFENCELNLINQLRAYQKIVNSNWLKYCKGILIGRTKVKDDMYGYNYETMLKHAFEFTNVPIIYDVDVGHIPPTIPFINGAFATVKYSNKKGTVEYKLI